MPWRGYHASLCDGQNQIGAPCIDSESRESGKIIEDCSCQKLTSIKNFEFSLIKISPNPSKDFIRIINSGNFEDYTILDINGSLIQQGKILNDQINVALLPSGYYLVQVSTQDLYKGTARFIKL